MPAKSLIRVLLVDDDEIYFSIISHLLLSSQRADFQVDWSSSYAAGQKSIAGRQHDVYLLDYCLDENTGIDLLRTALDAGCSQPMIMLTAQGDHELDLHALQTGAADYLDKSQLNLDQLERSIFHALERARTLNALQASQVALAESEARFRSLFIDAPMGLARVGRDLHLLQVNHSLALMLGYNDGELAGRELLDLCAFDDRPALREQLENVFGAAASGATKPELRFLRHNGDTIWVRLTLALMHTEGEAPYAFAALEDVTDRKRLETELQQAQRLEAVGTLAGGIAHDFNNLLSVVMGHCELLEYQAEPGSPQAKHAAEIRRAAEKATMLTRQLVAFSRGQQAQLKQVNLNNVIRGTQQVLRSMIGEQIELMMLLDPELGPIWADPSQMEQVIFNLALNARDAMPGGGKLIIETASQELRAEVQGGLPPGHYVQLSVTDTGIGMPPDIMDRIFEPFFTTKEKYKGTGLGLSTVYGIVQQCKGSIRVDSTPGQGTSFTLFFPRYCADRHPASHLCAN